MPLFKKRKDAKSETEAKERSKSTSTSSPPLRKPSVPYRHIPTRAAHDARDIRLPKLSLDTSNLNMQHDLRAIHSAPSPSPSHGGRFFSTKHRPWSREHASPGDRSSPLSPKLKSLSKDKPSPIDRPTSPHSTPYRHVPTHAATDAFRTSAGTQAGWHSARIKRLEDHSKRLSVALTKPGIRRFGSSSSSSSSSVASIDSILCTACSSSGKTLNRKCSQQHLKPRSSKSSDSESSVTGTGSSAFARGDGNVSRPSVSYPDSNVSETSTLESILEDEVVVDVAAVAEYSRFQIAVG